MVVMGNEEEDELAFGEDRSELNNREGHVLYACPFLKQIFFFIHETNFFNSSQSTTV